METGLSPAVCWEKAATVWPKENLLIRSTFFLAEWALSGRAGKGDSVHKAAVCPTELCVSCLASRPSPGLAQLVVRGSLGAERVNARGPTLKGSFNCLERV